MPPKPVHPDVERRIAAIVRGPHARPECDAPTWTTPPEPWPAMRSFVTACAACSRPLEVRVRPELVVRGISNDDAPRLDPVTELLDTPGVRSFRRRLTVAALAPVAAMLLIGTAGSWNLGVLVAAVLVV